MKEESRNRKLENIARDGEFIVPEGYFHNMVNEIEKVIKLDENDKVSARTVGLEKRIPKPLYYFVAAACLLIGVLLYNSSSEVECQTFACLLEETEITSSDIELIDQDDMTDFLDDDYNDEYLNL